jgi:HSP90 family molecular chaperone
MKDSLKKYVSEVKLSKTLVDIPCTIHTGEFGVSLNQEKIYKQQTMGEYNFFKSEKKLEINPHHVAMQG